MGVEPSSTDSGVELGTEVVLPVGGAKLSPVEFPFSVPVPLRGGLSSLPPDSAPFLSPASGLAGSSGLVDGMKGGALALRRDSGSGLGLVLRESTGVVGGFRGIFGETLPPSGL